MLKEREIQISDVFTDTFTSYMVAFTVGRVLALSIALSVVILVAFNTSFDMVSGPSMSPNAPHGSASVSVSKDIVKIKSGDIVICKYPGDENGYIKRVIGLPGDIINIINGKVYVNDEELIEDYTLGVTKPENKAFTQNYKVEEGHYFVLGDNREESVDSREFGAIPESEIIGKNIYIFSTGRSFKKPSGIFPFVVLVIYMLTLLAYKRHLKKERNLKV